MTDLDVNTASQRAGADDQRNGAKSSEAPRKARDQAAEAARAIADSAAVVGHKGAAAAEEVARAASNTAAESLRSGISTAADVMQRATDQYMQAFGLAGDAQHTEEAARESSRNISALADCNSIMARGAQDISREWLALARSTAEKNLQAMNELAACRSLPDLFAVQSRLLRENMEQMFSAGQKIANRSLQAAQDATARIAHRSGQHPGSQVAH